MALVGGKVAILRGKGGEVTILVGKGGDLAFMEGKGGEVAEAELGKMGGEVVKEVLLIPTSEREKF